MVTRLDPFQRIIRFNTGEPPSEPPSDPGYTWILWVGGEDADPDSDFEVSVSISLSSESPSGMVEYLGSGSDPDGMRKWNIYGVNPATNTEGIYDFTISWSYSISSTNPGPGEELGIFILPDFGIGAPVGSVFADNPDSGILTLSSLTGDNEFLISTT